MKASEARNTTFKMSWNPKPRRRPGWSPWGGQKCESTQLLSQLEEEVEGTTLTVLVVCFSNSRRLELEYGCSGRFFCGCEHECGGHGTNQCPCFRRMSESNMSSSGTVGSLCFNESRARDLHKFDVECISRKRPAGDRCKVSRGLVWRCVQWT